MPNVRIRRIFLHERDEQGRVQVFQGCTQFFAALNDEVGKVEKPLFLHLKFGVPFWALSYVFGGDDSPLRDSYAKPASLHPSCGVLRESGYFVNAMTHQK
jgi:hypothetical protein